MKPGLYLRSLGRLEDADEEMRGIGVCREGIEVMLPKTRHFTFMVRGMDPRGANILKQEMLAVGGEAAISYGAISDLSKPTDCLLSGTERQLRIAICKLERQPFGLKRLAADLGAAMDRLSVRGAAKVGPLRLGRGTLVMGILNTSPDSFSGDGVADPALAAKRALEMEKEGAAVIDIGGASTRPGSSAPGAGEELERTIPVIKRLKGRLKVPISIDSREPEVIETAVRAGARMVNLVGGIRDADMARLVARLKVPVVLMHMQGEPGSMQESPSYVDVMDDIVSDLRCQAELAAGCRVSGRSIIVDPGICFGKTVGHNLEILRRLGEMRLMGFPVLVGASRKSFIGKVLDAGPAERLEGSIAAAVMAAMNGADIVRAHDVRGTVMALRLADAVSLRAG